jgi:hypothetical protein
LICLLVNIDILLFGNDNLSVEINTFIFSCVQKYIKDTQRFSWTNKSTCNIIDNFQHCVLLHVRIFFSWSHLGYWLIDVSQVDEIYMCYSVQIVLARSQIPTYKLCLIVIRSKYATHIHHVFKNLRCARFAIYYTLAHSMFHRLLKFAFFVLLYGFFSSSSSSSYSEQMFYYYVFNAVLIICKLM